MRPHQAHQNRSRRRPRPRIWGWSEAVLEYCARFELHRRSGLRVLTRRFAFGVRARARARARARTLLLAEKACQPN